MKKYTIDYVKDYVSRFDYKCLTKYYINCHQKIKIKCPQGHIYFVRFDAFKNMRQRCPECHRLNSIKYTKKEVSKIISKYGYKWISGDLKQSTFSKLELECENKHRFIERLDCFLSGTRCSICSNIKAGLKRGGENNPNWQGGISCEPYCDVWLDYEFKESIKERDKYICLNPYCFKQSNRLSIHHIDYNKKNCHPRNLITLCNSCNSFANFNREWHKSWYQALMYNRYGYQY